MTRLYRKEIGLFDIKKPRRDFLDVAYIYKVKGKFYARNGSELLETIKKSYYYEVLENGEKLPVYGQIIEETK